MVFYCDKNHRTEILPCVQDKPKRCPKCGGGVRVDMSCTGRVGIVRSRKHRGYYCVSQSAAVHPDQIPEMKQMFPHHEFLSDGRMAFTSRSHRKRCLRDIGVFDRDGNDSPVNK